MPASSSIRNLPTRPACQAGAAGDEHHLAQPARGRGVEPQVLQAGPRRVAEQAPWQGVQQGPRLLVDLLEHEVPVAALRRRQRVVGHGLEGALDRRPVQRG